MFGCSLFDFLEYPPAEFFSKKVEISTKESTDVSNEAVDGGPSDFEQNDI